MRKIHYILCLLALCGACLSLQAKKSDKAQMKTVYIFGFASSFVDTVAYMTDIQALDSAYIQPNGFLSDRMLYSAQLTGYTAEKRGLNSPTTAVFFAEQRSKLEKKYQKLKKMYQQDKSLQLVCLEKGEFVFTPEEYIAPLEPGETPVADSPAAVGSAPETSGDTGARKEEIEK